MGGLRIINGLLTPLQTFNTAIRGASKSPQTLQNFIEYQQLTSSTSFYNLCTGRKLEDATKVVPSTQSCQQKLFIIVWPQYQAGRMKPLFPLKKSSKNMQNCMCSNTRDDGRSVQRLRQLFSTHRPEGNLLGQFGTLVFGQKTFLQTRDDFRNLIDEMNFGMIA